MTAPRIRGPHPAYAPPLGTHLMYPHLLLGAPRLFKSDLWGSLSIDRPRPGARHREPMQAGQASPSLPRHVLESGWGAPVEPRMVWG